LTLPFLKKKGYLLPKVSALVSNKFVFTLPIFGLYLIFNWRSPSYKKASSKSEKTTLEIILEEYNPSSLNC
jgi:hypothetical protein